MRAGHQAIRYVFKTQFRKRTQLCTYNNKMAHVIDSLADGILEMDRFVEVSNRETIALVEKQKNDNTRRMTDCHVRLLRSYLDTRREHRLIEDIPPVELDLLLAQFFLGVRKAVLADSDEFDSLMTIRPRSIIQITSRVIT